MSLCPTIEKTEAIALRVSDFSNTSQMVAWLTSDGRRLVTSAKGALRPRSPFLGQYDLGYTCEILYYSHGGTGAVHVLHECTPLDARASLRARWRSPLSAEYALDLLGQVAATAHANPAFYALLRATLDHLVRRGTSAAALLAFETRLLSILGLAPDLEGCPHCLDTALALGARFSVPEGRVVCPMCAGEAAASAEITLSHRLLAPLRLAFGADAFAPTAFTRLDAADLAHLRRFLGIFLHYHLDARLDGRAIAWDAYSS
jgi:DNA repair protein RecO (recombination protein O)